MVQSIDKLIRRHSSVFFFIHKYIDSTGWYKTENLDLNCDYDQVTACRMIDGIKALMNENYELD